ncbi:MAG: glutathione S-transferase N-terminal domain-containing protein [Actinomycetota bacterium]|nr:glutathione S-transferase N-terminal domain-containing protein [Actinomycetota bacterium]
MSELPVLWHLKVSHYNEKARWALDYKGVPHLRRAVTPGAHRPVARRLTGGTTLPILELDGRAIGDSTAIIAELERRQPRPALYPADPVERGRALDLEELFDEELGPCTRLLFIHHVLPDRDLTRRAFTPDASLRQRVAGTLTWPLIRRRTIAAFGIDAASVEHAFRTVRAVGERFQAEVGPDGYLVGDAFTIADLTLASLVSPVVAPEQFPYPQPQRGHPLVAPVVEAIAESGMADWARSMYARHRGESAEVVPERGRSASGHYHRRSRRDLAPPAAR